MQPVAGRCGAAQGSTLRVALPPSSSGVANRPPQGARIGGRSGAGLRWRLRHTSPRRPDCVREHLVAHPLGRRGLCGRANRQIRSGWPPAAGPGRGGGSASASRWSCASATPRPPPKPSDDVTTCALLRGSRSDSTTVTGRVRCGKRTRRASTRRMINAYWAARSAHLAHLSDPALTSGGGFTGHGGHCGRVQVGRPAVSITTQDPWSAPVPVRAASV